MKAKTKTLTTVLSVLLMGLMGCNSTSETNTLEIVTKPEEASPLRSAHSSWIEEKFQTEVVNIGLEKLGYKVEEPKAIEYPAMLIAMANGDLDYSPTHGERGHAQFFEAAGGEEKLARVGYVIPNLVQGYQIDKKTADKYNITNVEQLKNPEIAKLFDSDGDGKANLTGCNPGWSCELAIEHHLDSYELRDTVEHDRGEYTALLANTIARYQQGEPVLYYAFLPHWIGSVLKPEEDVIWLEVPFTSLPPEMGEVTTEDTTVNGKNLGFLTDPYRVVANKEFLAANPIAKRWFELVQIPHEDVNKESMLINEGEDKAEDIRRHAEEWVEQNQEKFDGWIEEARKAAVSQGR
ncbi:MAG: glycine betaine/L-proline ABC transporter substrate-binding protein ProX [Cyanobacteriota bacterium]|nr:glycine betaine/L-proline ABC transporter substrate-binding protein ProX [Cyanobacteriota bacterium]